MLSKKLIVSGSILNILTVISTVIVSFFMMPFMIGELGDKWYGLWILVATFIGYYGVFDFGISAANQRFISKDLGEEGKNVNRIVSSSFFMLLALSIIALLLALLVFFNADIFVTGKDEVSTFRTLTLILGVKFFLTFPLTVFHGVISSHLRYDLSSFVLLFKLTVRTVAIYIYMSQGYGVIVLALITVITDILGYMIIIAMAFNIHKGLAIKIQLVDKILCRRLIYYSKYVFLTHIGDILRTKVDTIIIGKLLGLSQITPFAVALRLVEYATELLIKTTEPFLPLMARSLSNNNNEIYRKFLLLTEISTLFTLSLISPIILFSEEFIGLWVGPQYSDIYPVVILLMLSVLISGATKVCHTVLLVYSKHKHYAYLNIFEALLNISISLALIVNYEIVGVALGTLLPMLLTQLYFLPKYCCKVIGCSRRDFYALIFRHTTIALFSVLVTSFLCEFITLGSYIAIICGSLLFYVIFFSLNYMLVLSIELKGMSKNFFLKMLNHNRCE